MAITVIDSYENSIATFHPPGNPATARIGGIVPRRIFFQVTSTTAAPYTTGDVLVGTIPKGATLVGGTTMTNASTGSTTVAFGLKGSDETGFIDSAATVSDNAAILKAAAAMTSITTQVGIGVTPALSFGYTAQKDLYLTMTLAAANLTDQIITGYLDFIPES